MTRALRFNAIVKADDFVVADHRVHGVRMMPGVTFLDMVWRLLRAKGHDPAQTEIVNVLFMQPVTVDGGQAREIAIVVEADDDGWAVVARSRLADDSVDSDWSENFRCRVRFLHHPAPITSSPWTLEQPATHLAMDEVYARARAVDIEHRAGMRMAGVVRKTATMAEATLRLTEQAAAFEDDYIVHPAMLDSATLIPFVFRAPGEVDQPYIPLSIERVTLAGPVRGEMRVRVRHDASAAGARDVLFHDYDICAPDGRVLVRVERLSAKRVRHRFDGAQTSIATAPSPRPIVVSSTASEATLRDWLTSYIASVLGRAVAADAIDVGFYDLGLDSRQLLEAVRVLERGLGDDLYPTLLFEQGSIGRLAAYLWGSHRAGAERLLTSGTEPIEPATAAPDAAAKIQADALRILYLASRWSTSRLGPPRELSGPLLLAGQAFDVRWPGGFTADAKKAVAALFVWRGRQDVAALMTLAGRLSGDATLVVAHGGGPEGAGLRGLLASVSRERPALRLACVERVGVKDLINLPSEVDSATPGLVAVRYRDGARETLSLSEVELSDAALPAGGCWLITGGLGQLGLHLARALSARGARVGLIGRTAPSSELGSELAGLGMAWTRGDVGDRASLQSALVTLRTQLGPFTGVIHAAGVLRDGLAMAGIAEDDATAVVTPKIAGAEHLDDLTRDDPLQHFVLFSSATGCLGNVGQGAYGYANGWLDGFAAARTGPGRTLSIGWPLWASGGMRGDAIEAARHGIVPLGTQAGLAAFGAALASDASHVVVLHGDVARLRDGLGLTPDSDTIAPTQAAPRTIEAPAVHRAETPRVDEPIAVIGLAGRYPGAKDLDAFWRNLADGVDAVTEVPKNRWDHAAYFDASGETPGTSWSRWGGFIDGVDQFDPLFFHIVPREARVMDPQERLFLETAWAAMEDAAIARETLAGRKVGVFAGVMWSHYQLYASASASEGSNLLPMSFNASVANRVSHALDLRGPSLSLDTACSSSLTALHLAIESLRRGECEMAFAGGVNLTLHPSKYQFLGQGRMLSRDGRCRAFGEGGDGYVPGEGVGVALLKPLSRAQADGDPVWGTILASGISHGGRTAGYTVPSAGRQQELIREVLAGANIKPTEISYIEAHGTGTALGDPIEVEGLKGAFGDTALEPWCALGSVKSNIGHLESAAGIAGLTKVLLQLRHRQLAPTLHADPLNSRLDIAGTPFRVQSGLTPWHAEGRRIAGLSSFGAGGAYAHLLIGEAPDDVQPAHGTTSPELIVLSARTLNALRQRADDLLRWLSETQAAAGLDVLAVLTDEAARALDIDPSSVDIGEEWDGLGLHGERLEQFRVRVEARLGRAVDAAMLSASRNLTMLARQLDARSVAADGDIAALAHTLQVGRSAFGERMAICVRNTGELRGGLQAFLAGQQPAPAGPAPLVDAARRFLAGEAVDWDALRAAPPPRRIGSLPVYPFERRSMWVTATPFAGAAQEPLPMRVAAPAVEADIAPSLDDILLMPLWRREARVISSERPEKAWIVAAPEQRHIATSFAGSQPGMRVLSWDEAIAELQRGDAAADLYLVAGGDQPLLALMRLLQALARHGDARRLRLITVGAHAVLPGETADPSQAGLGAFLRSALRELPGTSAACIDLGIDDDPVVALDETCVPLPYETAWRGRARFRRRLHPVGLPAAISGLKHGGRYLISGGAGRVGIALATELARRFAARIVLVGRRQADAAIAQALESIGQAGGTGFYISADIADPAGAHHTVERAAEKLGGLDGVIHAAAAYEERSLASLTEQDIAAALRPKLDGLRALAAACRNRALDGFMVFSSAQIHAGNPGRAHYAAACAATDAAALDLARHAPWPVRIVNWGFWEAGEVGTEAVRAQLAAQGAQPLSAREAVEALSRIWSGPSYQVAALRLDTAMRPFLGVDDSERWQAVAPVAPSDFAVLRSLTVAPDHDGRVAACRVGFEAVNRHALDRFAELLRRHGLFIDAKANHTGNEIATALAALPQHCRLVDAALAHLLEAGWLRRSRNGFALADAWPAVSDTSTASTAEMAAHLRLLDDCLDALPDILAGRVPATDVMFPDGSPALVEGIYRGNPAADWFNRQAADAVLALARSQRDRGETHLRIVEVGAGSGGTSAAVLAALDTLAGDQTLDYVFSDVSPSFLKEGRRTFAAGRLWLNFRQLDIETDPVPQGFTEGGFDIVLAANVLHATRRIDRSLGHVTRLLRPGGVLIACEAVDIEPFTTFTFGLLDGWWMSEDAEARLPHGPLLSPDGWRAAFADGGFADALVLPGPATTPALDAMRVIVAQSGGLVRQTAAPVASVPAIRSPDMRVVAHVASDNGDRRRANIEQRVAMEIASALEFDTQDIGATTPFSSLGIDSILAVEASRRINAGLGIALRSTDLFNFADVRRLATHIATAFPDCLAEPVLSIPSTAPTHVASRPSVTASVKPDLTPSTAADMPIAIIGMSGRFPDADNLDAFWANLDSGHDAVREIPANRWPLDGFYDPARPDRSSGKWGGFLSGIDGFDPAYFQMSPREAELTDPQHRLFLMESVRALEDAGQTRATLDGSRLGIFVGCKTGDYFRNLGIDDSNAQAFTGNANAILPARLAYCLNTVGPTLAVDTACSSALVALHLAVQSLRAGECETAIAGAVALMATPHTHLMLSRANMLSPTGRCRAFDTSADGFVPGEGVGVVVLKPLNRALADGDPIHGVIRASAINQDGRTSSITAPSAPSQTRLISECYAQANIDPASIGYVEAHGTGTKLGDPIEAAALTDAFVGRVPADWRGTLGSVKSMLGHTMEAAGMAGLFKLLLMLRHRRQAPSLHFARPNEHIDFVALPFGVLTEGRTWDASPDGTPRRAAISAFGFSGTNAHVVIEEAPLRVRQVDTRRPVPAFFVSARTAGSLRQRCRDLADWLDRNRDTDFVALSATLMLGRDHHGHRAAVCGETVAEIMAGWRAIADGKTGHGVLVGTGGEVRSEPALLELGKLLIERINDPTLSASDYRDKLAALADLYVKGYALTFETLFAQGRPVFVSLPPYPFDLRRCWIDAKEMSATIARPSGLLGDVDPSASLGDGLVFRSVLSPGHWVLAHHKVRGRALLPAAAFLALAVEAGRRVLGAGAIAVSDVRWRQALYGDSDVEIVTTVGHDGLLTVATHAGIHMQCRVSRTSGDARDTLDLATIRAGMTHSIDGAEFYARCAASGLAFGERFRRVQTIEGDGTVAVSRITADVGGSADGFDAGLLDAVLQTVGGRLPTTTLSNGRAVMPAALDRLAVFSPMPEPASAVARLEPDGRFTIDVVDDDGRIAMHLSGLAFVELPVEQSISPVTTGASEGLDIYLPHWVVDDASQATISVADSVAILGGARAPQLVAALRRLHPQANVLAPDADPSDATLIYDFDALDLPPRDARASIQGATEAETSVVRLMHMLQRLDGRQIAVRVVTDRAHAIGDAQPLDPRGAAVLGFAKAAAREMSCDIAAVDIDVTDDADGIAALLAAEPRHGHGEDIAMRNGVRFRRTLVRAGLPAALPPFRQGGTYLIVGGSGGLGRVLSQHLAERYGANLAWIGRRPEDDTIRAAMQGVRAVGGEAIYLSADVADAEALGCAVAAVKTRFGAIHGVVHSALVLRDALVAGMREADLRAVLGPKTRGIAALDAAVKDEALDFFAMFSSAIAFSGNAGQANYAAASLFVDAYAAQLRSLRAYPVVTIDWGYWGEVGVVADATTRRRMETQGILSISPDAGINALARVLSSGIAQAMPIRLTADKRAEMAATTVVQRRVGGARAATMPHAEFPPLDDVAGSDAFYAALNRYARRKVGQVLRFAAPAQGQSAALSDVRQKLALAPDQEQLFAALLDMLVREGIATVTGERIGILGFPEAEPPTSYVKAHSHLPLLDACLDGLADVLAGRHDAAQILFPGGSRHLVEAVYTGNAVMAACDTMLGRLAADFVARHPNAPLRILEIGGGTGAASRPVLAALAPFASRLTYVFTDISRSFVARAEIEFGATYPFVRFAPLDVAVAPQAQGFENGAYDLVIASNVLHAVGDLAEALGHAKSLLRPGGLLLINEVTTVIDFVTLTFGLTPGWWAHRGVDGRLPHAPLLSAARWRDRLAAEGFGPVAVFGPPGQQDTPSQAIIAAIGDGWARHAVSVTAPITAFDVAAPAQRQAGDTALAFVRRVFARVLRMTEAELDDDATFETFGVDSLLVIDLNRAFEAELGRVPATILYEARTLRNLAQRLATEFGSLPAAPTPVQRQGAQAATRIEPDPSLRIASPVPVTDRRAADEPIAVIGMACRFPGAANVEAYWSLLREGRSAISEIPAERWDWRAMPAGTRGEGGRHYSRWGGFIADVDAFDPLFFGISPQEAETLDPQERLFLQTAWHALEDGGYPPPALKGRPIGVFVGAMNAGYEWLSGRASANGHSGDAHSAYWSIANRVSYAFDLQGPSLAVDTACSSSLTALHLACDALRRGDCEAAIVGGVNVIAGPVHYARLCGLGMLSEGPECRSFGDGADGFVDGEGVGAMLLKPLSQALADGDQIHGVIRASAVNAGGKTGGYTVPNPAAQTEVITRALQRAGLAADTISYVEAHGTGTLLGDPIELAGLNAAFRQSTQAVDFCALGSVKSNIGHLESAAGIAGLIKVLLMFKHRTLAPTLHAEPANPKLALDGSPFRLQHVLASWDAPTRRAGISSFGAGGANAHVVVEEAPARAAGADIVGPQLIVLSADDGDQLIAQADALRVWLTGRSPKPSHAFASVVAEVLGVAEADIDPNAPLHELGLDAGAAARLATLLRERLDLDVPVRSDMTLALLSGADTAEIPSLAALAFTLQTGRAPLAVRFAAMVEDLPALIDVLDAFIECRAVPPMTDGGRGGEIGRGFLNGEAIDFRSLWSRPYPERLALPPYAFRRERYWIPELVAQPAVDLRLVATTLADNVAAPAVIRFPARQQGARVAVIGGGPSGLVAAKSLREAGYDPVLFERSDRIGGIWAQREQAPYGTYRSTRLQSSKYTALFSDFPAHDDMPVFPGAADLETYFNAYADRFELRQTFRLSTTVRDLAQDGEGWRLRQGNTGGETEERFDAVALCPGLFGKPKHPDVPGRALFRGRVLHSSEYAEPSVFAGQRVLVVGNGVSGMDIAAELSDIATVSLAVRTPAWVIPRMVGFVPNDCSLSPLRRLLMRGQPTSEIVAGWREAMPQFMDAYARSGLMPVQAIESGLLNVNDRLIERVDAGYVAVAPAVQSFDERGVVFADESRGDFDTVIFCTGFELPRVPFVGGDPADLYKSHFHAAHANMAVIGLYPTTLGCFSTIELGARWFAQVLSGKARLPDRETMRHAVALDRQRADAFAGDGTQPAVVPVDTPVDNIWFAEQIGAFPDPATDWRLYWELLNSPPIPAIYRLQGPHAWDGARAHIDKVRSRLFVKAEDGADSPVADAMLADLGADVVRDLAARGEIDTAQAERVLRLIPVAVQGGAR